MVKTLYNMFVSGNQKTIVAFVLPLLLGFIFAHFGISGDMTVKDALSLVATSLLTALGVHVKANK